MASLGSTPVRELTDSELRKRLLALGYDVPVSVNRDFLVKKLENASATAVGGGGGKSNKRHSVAVTPSSSPAASPNAVRKRKSMAATPRDSNRAEQNNVSISATPNSPLASSPPMTPQYVNSPGLSSIATPSTPSPFVSRLGTPSSSASPNGEMGHHSPRYMSYYNMFKANPNMGGDGGHVTPRSSSGDSGGGYGYSYNRSIRLSAPPGGFNPVTSVAPPSKSDRNGYVGAIGGSLGIESDWCGGTLVSKILVGLFILFFLVIGGLYVRQNIMVDPRGLTGTVVNVEERKESQSAPPITKKPEPVLPPVLASMTYPICGLKGVDPEACIQKDVVKNSRTLFNTLKEELTQRGKRKGCYSDVQEVISLHEAKLILYKLTDLRKGDVDAAFHGMLLLLIENPKGGLSLVTDSLSERDITGRDAAVLDLQTTKIFATDVNPDFICGVVALLTSLTMTATVASAGVALGYLVWRACLFYRKRKKSEEDEIFEIVENVIASLGRQYELSLAAPGTDNFLAVNHIRDELMPPKDRQKKEALWNKVVDYISNHESRVREEIQHIGGEEFKVWRWLPSASPRQSINPSRYSAANSQNKLGRFSMPGMSSSPIMPSTSGAAQGPALSPIQKSIYPSLSGLANDDEEIQGVSPLSDNNSNNKWQGQAFETCEGSPNALPTTPTTCLKIRHMFTERETTLSGRTRIEQEILGKCRNARILHIGMDPGSVEGCVYIRCSTKDDARMAFMALHGWWFDGHLLSVKFLKEERYFNRFPEAKNCTVPMGLSQ